MVIISLLLSSALATSPTPSQIKKVCGASVAMADASSCACLMQTRSGWEAEIPAYTGADFVGTSEWDVIFSDVDLFGTCWNTTATTVMAAPSKAMVYQLMLDGRAGAVAPSVFHFGGDSLMSAGMNGSPLTDDLPVAPDGPPDDLPGGIYVSETVTVSAYTDVLRAWWHEEEGIQGLSSLAVVLADGSVFSLTDPVGDIFIEPGQND